MNTQQPFLCIKFQGKDIKICELISDCLTYYQFCNILKQESPTPKKELLKAFKKIDINGDGFITHDELISVLTTVILFQYSLLRLISSLHEYTNETYQGIDKSFVSERDNWVCWGNMGSPVVEEKLPCFAPNNLT